MKNRVMHFFGNVSMTNGHDGLAELAASKVDVDELKPGEFVAFINKSFSAMKLMSANGILVHWRKSSHKQLYETVVDTLPRFMQGEDIGYTREVSAAIARYYKKFLQRKQAVRAAAEKVAA